jgi:hypothetical protein
MKKSAARKSQVQQKRGRPRPPHPEARARAGARASKDARTASDSEWIELPPPTRDELFHTMRTALHEAQAFMQAASLMGRGLTELGSDYGDAVQTVADATHERLETMHDAWLDYVQMVEW